MRLLRTAVKPLPRRPTSEAYSVKSLAGCRPEGRSRDFRGTNLCGGTFIGHLVPEVDDGARSLEEALEAVERMAAAGIGQIVTTPHVNASLTA